MSLSPGSRLGSYEISALLGAGGMGEVYAANDSRLRRSVAIKLLPEAFSGDPERLARFEREAQLLASLGHPNIAAIHGLEEHEGKRFLVLELVEGETLAERLQSGGALGLEEALRLARQVAEALEAAHEKGIIHRDLKPANIKIRPDGMVKLLDFGLAKALAAGARPSVSMSPTITTMTTATGVILGTAAYMSPEQARAKAVDRRADIWAFGCVLFEALTGRAPFHGETVTDTLSMILKGEPDWSALPARTPPRARELLQRCLEKELRNRLHDIGDARIELERSIAAREWTDPGFAAAVAAGPAARSSPSMFIAALVLAFAFGLAAGIASFSLLRGRGGLVTRMSIVPSRGMKAALPVVSPDGQLVAFQGTDVSADPPTVKLYTRRLDSYEDVAVPMSEDVRHAAISHDGLSLCFLARAAPRSERLALWKVPVDGSAPPVLVSDWPPGMQAGFAWLPDGHVVGVTGGGTRTVHFIHTEGKTPRAPLTLRAEGFGAFYFSLTRPLPDGRHVLGYADSYTERGWQMNVVALDTQTGEARILVPQGSVAAYSSTGHLVFSRNDTLLALPFDPERLQPTGAPQALATGVQATDLAIGWFDLSHAGTLVYVPGGVLGWRRKLAIVSPDGTVKTWSDEIHWYEFSPTVTPDGRRLAVAVTDLVEGVYEIWISDLERPRLRPLVDRPATDCAWQTWMPDGRGMVFTCQGRDGAGGIYLIDVEVPEERRLLLGLREGEHLFPMSISPDGRWAILSRPPDALVLLSLEGAQRDGGGGDRNATPLLGPGPGFGSAQFSPDGLLVSFSSAETGRSEVYVAPFDAGRLGTRRMVSTGGGFGGIWGKGSTEGRSDLYYNQGGRLMAVTVTTRPSLSIREPRVILDAESLRINGLTTLPDHRFLAVIRGEDEDIAPPINLVLNWTEELRARLPL